MFHPQHALDELLESTDTQIKDELSLIVPLTVWQQAATYARKRGRAASKRSAELDGMLFVRSEDATKLHHRLEEARAFLTLKERSFNETQSLLQNEINELNLVIGSRHRDDNFERLESEILKLDHAVKELEQEHQTVSVTRDAELDGLEQQIEKLTSVFARASADLRALEEEHSGRSLRVTRAKDRVSTLEQMWNIDLSIGMPESFSVPASCPTCHQLISGCKAGHSHEDLESSIKGEIEAALLVLSDAQSALDDAANAVELATASRLSAENDVNEARNYLNSRVVHWNAYIKTIDDNLRTARSSQQSASNDLKEAAKRLELQTRIQSIDAKVKAEKETLLVAAKAVDVAKDEFDACKARIKEVRFAKQEQLNISQIMVDLTDAFGPRGVQMFVLQNAVSLLESATRRYLDELSEGAQRLHLSLDSADRILKRAFIRGADGSYKERALASLSGGQWRRCSLALNLGFAELIAQNFRPSIVVMDEPLTHLDYSGRADVGRVLRKMLRRTSEYGSGGSSGFGVSTILIILQDLAAQELDECFDSIDEVVKENGSSMVVLESVGE
jgi:DNA repair exonuclease SbcCD ATPase subunit